MSEKSVCISEYFECPSCKGDMIEEVVTGVTLCEAVSDMHLTETGAVEVEYNIDSQHELGGTHWGNGSVDRYQCANCGWVIMNDNGTVEDAEDLFEWLQTHKESRKNP